MSALLVCVVVGLANVHFSIGERYSWIALIFEPSGSCVVKSIDVINSPCDYPCFFRHTLCNFVPIRQSRKIILYGRSKRTQIENLCFIHVTNSFRRTHGRVLFPQQNIPKPHVICRRLTPILNREKYAPLAGFHVFYLGTSDEYISPQLLFRRQACDFDGIFSSSCRFLRFTSHGPSVIRSASSMVQGSNNGDQRKEGQRSHQPCGPIHPQGRVGHALLGCQITIIRLLFGLILVGGGAVIAGTGLYWWESNQRPKIGIAALLFGTCLGCFAISVYAGWI